MKASPSVFYRIASILLVLFAIGHTVGFLQVDPQWGVDSLVSSMRTMHFNVLGSNRTYWDFFVGFGFFATVCLLFASVLAWEIGGLGRETLKVMPVVTWSLAICFAGITVLCAMYFFIPPIVFSALITLCLVMAAWLAGKESAVSRK